MPIADWNVAMTLISPLGSLDLNDPTSPDGYYVVDNANCKSGPAVRPSADNVPQGNGAILHRGFFGGYLLQMAIQYYADMDTAACATTTPSSETMNDLLMRHLVAILDGGGRLLYQPEGKLARLADQLQLSGTVVDLTEIASGTGVSFTLESQLPYTIDFTQTDTTLDAGTPTQNLVNDGSIGFLPVAKVHGPFSDFTLTNADQLDSGGSPLQIVYDDSLPGAVAVGGGDYIEISFFHNTVYLNGSGASRKAGINILQSDFFPLGVGDNHLTIASMGTAPTTHILWQPAWF